MKHNFLFDRLLRGTNIKLDKTNPMMGGLILVLGLHALQKDRARRTFLEQEYLETMEGQLFYAMLDSGIFDTPQPTEHRTPFGVMLGIPMSFN